MHQTVTALCESVLHPLALDAGALARRVETSSGGIEDGPAQWRAAITEALRLC
jgi:hypothetical protein